MKTKRLQKIFLCLITLFFLSSLTSMALGSEPLELKSATAFGSHTDWEKGFWMFFERVNKDAKGRLKLNYVGGPEAIPPFELIESVRKGVVDVIENASSYFTSHVPEIDSLKLSRITPSEERERGGYDLIRKIVAAKINAHYLGRINTGVKFHFYTKPKIEKIEDFRGLKIRVTALYRPFLLALGGTPVVMAHSEIYTALERGLVQGIAAGAVGIYERGWHEHLKYIIDPGFYVNEQVILFNLDTWNKIPKDVQQLLTKTIIDIEKESFSLFETMAKRERAALINSGMEAATIKNPEKYLDLAYEAGWNFVINKSPEYGMQLKRLLSK